MYNDKEVFTSARGAGRRRFIKQSSALLASGLAIGFHEGRIAVDFAAIVARSPRQGRRQKR